MIGDHSGPFNRLKDGLLNGAKKIIEWKSTFKKDSYPKHAARLDLYQSILKDYNRH